MQALNTDQKKEKQALNFGNFGVDTGDQPKMLKRYIFFLLVKMLKGYYQVPIHPVLLS